MTKIVIVAGGPLGLSLPLEDQVTIGVDRGCLTLLEAGLSLDWAVGDFDSVTIEERNRIFEHAQHVVELAAEKNDTDLEVALRVVLEHFPQGEVTVYGALGGRLDHSLANLFWPSQAEFAPLLDRVQLVDDQNRVLYRGPGWQTVAPLVGFTYVSFMVEPDSPFEIEGARYPLNASNYFYKKIYGSNEFLDRPIRLRVEKGYVLIIYSRDRR
ncbi:thiamine diphosphokinase [Streptococcus sp. NLN76]|uniref:thiamine diphosphokinase n=1 Tax=Streptococcus sp. NLN76 TaxID=2822800 RepID=UPI0018A9CDC3|nr:thiamine diphosphokinase [Streptococcus sp. NLN76]MBF8970686.1 thiamine diphosphokinase [Streptococcus sp. NLN76]